MKQTPDIWSSLSAVLNGNATEKEKQEVEIWLAQDDKNKDFWKNLHNTSYNKEIEENASGRQEYIYIKTQSKIQKTVIKRRLRIWQYVAAASVCLMLLMGGYQMQQTVFKEPILMETKSPAGNITTVLLSDGTKVDLNASSTIKYPLYFEGKTRTVELDGEAYFAVTPQNKKPFIVEANHMKIEVLGTHFNISSYSDDEQTVTTLLEGSVRIEIDHPDFTGKKPVILNPDQQIIYNKTTQTVSITEVKSYLYAAWKDGQCYFEKEKFGDITRKLERQFGVNITILSPELKDEIYSGFFSKKEGLRQILNSFKRYRNFDYREDDKAGIEIYEIK